MDTEADDTNNRLKVIIAAERSRCRACAMLESSFASEIRSEDFVLQMLQTMPLHMSSTLPKAVAVRWLVRIIACLPRVFSNTWSSHSSLKRQQY